jgi:hypothetical protein
VPQRLSTYFSASQELRTIAQKTQELAALQQQYRQIAPPTLATASQVIGFERHTLVIGANNNTVAAKLRQLAPQFILLFNGVGSKVTGIRVKVQVARPLPHRKSPNNSLSVAGSQQLAKLAESLPDSPLKKALYRFSKST